MSAVASFFLRAKHWQLFLLFSALSFIGQIALAMAMPTAAQSTDMLPNVGLLFGIVIVLFMLCFLGWFWALGSFLNSIVQPTLRLKSGFFRFAVVYPALYVPIFVIVFQSTSTNPILFGIIFPLHFFATFCMFYLLYFVSKNLVLAQTGKPASFYDYAGPFFLIWFFPIGIWIIQPRVNRLYAGRENVEVIGGATTLDA